MRWLKRPERERSESSCAWQRVWDVSGNVRFDGSYLQTATTYVVCAVQTEESVRGEHLRAGGEGMADLEKRRNGEALVQLGAQAGEGLVGEEDAPLDL